ncbi:protein SUPPRESSOR OF MAX2 1-like [Telopea speciosissima]|uniref:protein SUPPRESSOR OF MAX2 1-like n=1 Tax=Telopea speciosissima TaxID=54955 RepID=UPI001CC3D4F5|nr:protein SUPPRESSOR OF MAX2 1-like [Telopea speciosissima]XP_043709095.1 protein SUPPRESSOR OF MAX2 1-like [Telopea speciosissima]XP_043709096.1 protein SUPPRESSOR OF MAX2 1-like [Telopea speciosissima]
MRAGLSTIQQTLTPEAASVLNHSIAEAARRNHGQTTPLHVAATLLASPSGYLRQACIRSHPNSSHPLQCRALELCFSVALERLPSAQNLSPGIDPPISNALMAALKRAQAHQRRGCPEQQQQPLLAVKVELEQLIVSILDDPSVSRVMREASFSSPAVKATIEQSLNASSSINSSTIGGGLGFRPAQTANRNLYLNPRLQQQQQQGSSPQSGLQRSEEVKKAFDILLRAKKRNPIFVGESELDSVVRELLQRIERREVGDGPLRNVQVISLDKDFSLDRTQIPMKLKELEVLVETKISNSNSSDGGGVILDLGDLKWLVEQPTGLGVPGSTQIQQQIVSETGRVAVAEMAKLLARFNERCGDRLWLIGTATCETYLRCQVYHPSMENDWDLQAVPITARNPHPGLFPRLGGNGILSSSVESLSPLKSFPPAPLALARRSSENVDPARRMSCCPQCMENYEQELAKLVAKQFEKSSSEAKPEATRSSLPPWLQMAKPDIVKDQMQAKDQELMWKQKTQELQKKWTDTCLHLHPSFHQSISSDRIAPSALSMTSLYNPNLLQRQPFQSKLSLTRSLGGTLLMNQSQPPNQHSERVVTPPESPVRTDLALGRPKISENSPEKNHNERIKDFAGCISSQQQDNFSDWQKDKAISPLDADSFKRLFKGLTEKVGWQPEAASAVATTVTQCKSGNNKRRGGGARGETWLLFVGPDRVGKKKMASALSELVWGSNPVTIHIGSKSSDEEELDKNFRGKTVLDRIAETVRRNPFSLILLEDIDQADMLVHGGVKRAMERGRLADSHGREVSLGNTIFILTASWLPENLKNLSNCIPVDEEKLASVAGGDWQLKLSVSKKTSKRQADWLRNDDRLTKSRKESGPGLSFDLNEAANAEDDGREGSRNSSDLTVEHENGRSLVNVQSSTTTASLQLRSSITPLSYELLNFVDEAIAFKPVDFGPLRSKIASIIASQFAAIVGDSWSIEVDTETLEKIVSGVWFSQTQVMDWADKVLVPSFHQMKTSLSSAAISDDNAIIRLVSVRDSERHCSEECLPDKITVVVDNGL